MSGRLPRAVCTAALAAVVAAPYAAPAGAEPVPGAEASPSAPSVTGAGPVTAPRGDGAPRSVSQLLTELRKLYRQAEEATEAYNATEVKLTAQQAKAKSVGTGLTDAREALVRSRVQAGRLARQQYQGTSELSSYIQLLLSGDPQHALDQQHLMDRAQGDRLSTIARLTNGERRADTLAAQSRKALAEQKALAAKQKRQRDTVRAKLADVEKMLASLTAGQIAAIAEREDADTDKAQEKLITSGALGDAAPAPQTASGAVAGTATTGGLSRSLRAPSAGGDEALTYAVGQIGKPYLWGAEGPESYDCSGLTSRAWARAGVSVPRTSQEQWAGLPRVKLSELRPGDLVVYFPKATHVAIYLGAGKVVHAPRPGGRVKVSPIASNPLLGAVRPDPGAAPLDAASYEPPELPPGATAGDDTGNNSATAPAG
ncbi:C40 family peptidase [Streptomyces sp. NBC_01716]|uniref:C40 family peptidase n=1 Tax=Streptomyces sp. NBC_01716 TaxID=2975917 RepID=UPI002E37C972|nr:NlpC/P60 family protein [Streptomyces sp. NBC_01716]